ncbi:GNAT family N-acetyltransferase [Psychrobacillus sp. FSL K6-2684]|uniref:GNAT family N-acetyltransferase n=1 Tax=unclassified Psychrobacillus TaxID=2636677 RepID=UPI00124461D2|nr:GNAT family N-acetyltransferase [Psychrobacillus sp. AK 1817]QEY19560.1 GNAT family N-acetyltransferase [Psychrobacillus sp. AK 1817]QGM30061.1 GNAT family N-acetyltransferase [Bacillus sp. N3536]
MVLKIVTIFTEKHLNDLFLLFQNEWWTKNRTNDDILKMLDLSHVAIGLVDSETDELVGFARAITDGMYRAFIFDVIVKGSDRNRGLGFTLMNSLLENSLIQSVERIELYCPERLVSYYEQFGFSTDVNGSTLMRLKR